MSDAEIVPSWQDVAERWQQAYADVSADRARAVERLRELADRVGDFKTGYTGEEGWRIIPDMLADMEAELVVARAFLAEQNDGSVS